MYPENSKMNGSVLRVKAKAKNQYLRSYHLGCRHKRYTCRFFVFHADQRMIRPLKVENAASVTFCYVFCMRFVWPLLFIISLRNFGGFIQKTCKMFKQLTPLWINTPKQNAQRLLNHYLKMPFAVTLGKLRTGMWDNQLQNRIVTLRLRSLNRSVTLVVLTYCIGGLQSSV